MADDLDVEALLEAPFRKGGEEASYHDNGAKSPTSEEGERRKKHKRKRSHRSRSRSKSRSRSRSKSPQRRRRSRSRSRDRRRRSRSRERRRRSRSQERREKKQSRSPHHQRKKSRSRSPRRRKSRSRSPPRRRQLVSPMLPPRPPPRRKRSPDPEPPAVDRDRRTVMCMQLAARVGPKELEEFFQQVGQVREVKMISDRNSRRSKGIAYVEFHDETSVPVAMGLAGQKLFGVPIIVQPTMAEKNRLAAQAQNLKKAEGPRKLYVGSLHYNINEAMLKAVFEPFGIIEKVSVQRDETGMSKGYGFVEFKDAEPAERAMAQLNGFELAGRPIKVNHVTERDMTGAMEMLDGEDTDVGVGMTPQSRAALMAKLAEGHNTGLTVPQVPQVSVPNIPAISSCFMLSNMFDPGSESELGWENDIRDDVLEECMRFGPVMHIYIDPFSQGNVYVKCMTPQVAGSAFNALNGRFFAGKKIVAQFIPETTYHIKFPAAMAAYGPLNPST